ncbi:MAG: hypothetical protein V2J89_06395 [Halieaceae bacterium]|nr:hypothetical protein [Halieaceae bacterium]
MLGLSLQVFGQTASEPATEPMGMPMDRDAIDAAGDLGSPSLDFQDSEDDALIAPDASSYQFYITDLESRYGPYAPGLSEQLLGLGAVYQRQGLHREAVEVFKRGVHIARINEGLNGPAQIPLLQREIQSLMALGDFEAADERQFYLYRVQAEAYGTDSAKMTAAMLERADWEREAYYLSLGDASFLRLLTMWELYGNVLRNVARSEGNLSAGLLRPLEGLLQTQYMISTYMPEAQMGLHTGAAVDDNFAEENRFSIIKTSNYKQGQAVLTAMREVYGYNEAEQSPRPAEALIRLGDWHLWHQKRDAAEDAYKRAWRELGALDDADTLRQRYFGRPTLLPDLPGARTAFEPPEVIRGYLTVSYNISPRGRVRDLNVVEEEVVQTVDDQDDGYRIQLLRSLKRKLYRPQVDNGEPVLVENVTERYAY